jgi:Peptidase family M23
MLADSDGVRGWCWMRICFAFAAVFILASGASAKEYGRPSAIIVNPIHEAQVVRGDDGMDHVEYELLVVSVFPEPVTLSSVTVLSPAGKELMRMDGSALAAATQTLFSKTPSPVVPILPPDTVPERVTHRIAYTLKADSQLGLLADPTEVDAPEVAINHQAAIVIRPPVKGDGWLAGAACCKPNVHRDERIAIDGIRIATAETFAIDSAKVRHDRIFDGDGKAVEQYYGFGEDVLAIADGTVVSVHDGMSDQTPFVLMIPKSKSDYGGNNVMLEIAPNVFAWYAHLRARSIAVQVGDAVKAGTLIGKLGNTGPSEGPHLHLGLLDKPDPIAGRGLPFVFDSFTLVGAVDFDKSEGDRVVVMAQSRQVRSEYPLYGGIQNYPDSRP